MFEGRVDIDGIAEDKSGVGRLDKSRGIGARWWY